LINYILDTNICIYIIKKKPLHVFEKFNSLPLGSVGISAITMAELQYGVHKSQLPEKNQKALNSFLLPLEIVPFEDNAAIEYGKIRSSLEKSGVPIGSLDILIGAHAKSLNAILVTNNIREFKRIEGLKIENWIGQEIEKSKQVFEIKGEDKKCIKILKT
jgi:tRNA(fMet)-specific endonuclease VapC